ncbi:MAG: hypothetical protein QM731_11155 [Chitinophagaceae bacterium]
MKKLLLILGLVAGMTAMAQTKPAASAKQDKKPATTETAKTAAGPVKKDGTPDKRYKANKQAADTVHMKKDGTPDKRFKENKKKN